jgi:hypothetical protein
MMKKMIRKIIAAFLILLSQFSFAKTFGIKVSQNATSFPVTGAGALLKPPIHAGLMFGYETKLNKSEKFQILNESNVGFIFHRFFQTAVFVNDVVKFNYAINTRFGLHTGIGAGYLHSFYQYSIFKLNDSGNYTEIKKLKGRPQFMAIFVLGASVGLKKENPEALRFTFEYRGFVHGTFAKSYVPLVPYNSIQLGIQIQLKEK